MLIDSGRLDDGVRLLEQELEAGDDAPASAVLLAARTRLRLSDLDAARGWFQRFVVAFPDRPEGRAGLAECAEAAGDWTSAIDQWSNIRRDFGDQRGPAWRRRVQANLFRAGRLDELHEDLREEFNGTEEGRRFWAVTSNSTGGQHVPLRYRHVLIITYGRSGSTLLQGVLNSIDGVLIRGENGNAFVKFFEVADHFSSHRTSYPHAFTANRAWFGISSVSDATVLAGLRDAARSILIGDMVDPSTVSCLGFKEIRYDELGDRLEAYLDFLQALFPECALVFNTRDLAATSLSGWWRDLDAHEVRDRLTALTERFVRYASERPNCFMIDYGDVTSKGARLRELFEFLGAEFDESRIDAVLAFPHSFDPTQPEIKAMAGGR